MGLPCVIALVALIKQSGSCKGWVGGSRATCQPSPQFSNSILGRLEGQGNQFILSFEEDIDGMSNWSFQSKTQILFSFEKQETLLKNNYFALSKKRKHFLNAF